MKIIDLVWIGALSFAAVTGWAQNAAPTDAEIAAIVIMANQVDIDAGELAKTKTQSTVVKQFAEQMVVDHSGVNQAVLTLVRKLNVQPENSATSQSLKQGGNENMAKLKELSGAQFDRAYIDHEVAYHQQVLDALDKTLIPSASNAELKALLVKVRPAFAAHLEHAKRVQVALAGGAS